MDEVKIRAIIAQLRERFEQMGIPKKLFEPELTRPKRDQMLMHCHAMLDTMEKHLDHGKLEKVNRWLGFIQGCLWQLGMMSLSSIRSENSIFLD